MPQTNTAATAPTVQTSAVTPYAQGVDHSPARLPLVAPGSRTVAQTLLADTMAELGIDADEGCSLAVMMRTPTIGRVMFAAKQLADIAQANATRRARFARLYSCGL